MFEKTSIKIIFGVLTLCILLTVAHLMYISYAYEHCSIIQFIAKELW